MEKVLDVRFGGAGDLGEVDQPATIEQTAGCQLGDPLIPACGNIHQDGDTEDERGDLVQSPNGGDGDQRGSSGMP